MSSEDLHVPREVLTQEGRLLHYAITSLKEELDAVDWYRQRADDTEDEQLREILLHNMREEMEHAAMVLEWLRRHEPAWDERLRKVLFTQKPLGPGLDAPEEKRGPAAPSGQGLGVGSLRKVAP